MKLSIIIPYYNCKEYTDELLAVLDKQIDPLGDPATMNPDIEVIVVDDGSQVPYKTEYPWCKVVRKKNGGCGTARNRGLKVAKGDYIQFIDADDMVPDYFIDKLMEAIEHEPDVIEYSWKSLTNNGTQHNFKLRTQEDRLPNPSACTRAFKRSYIGKVTFNEFKDATEDEEFSRRLGYLDPERPCKRYVIPDYMYFYRTEVQGSQVKLYKEGLRRTKRVVYYYNHVTADMTDVLESIKEDDKLCEVFLMTNQCDIPEMKLHCQIIKPSNLWTHYLKGEPYTGCQLIPLPVESQVILYINWTAPIGGIESFIYHFATLLSETYDITLVVNTITEEQKRKISQKIRVVRYSETMHFRCDTLIMLRILDKIPSNFKYKQSVQMCHACRTNQNWHIPQNSNYIVNVSKASKESFGEEAKNGIVIHNPIIRTEDRALILVSATRIPAPDKGNNEQRMRTLAEKLSIAKIPFLWFNFSDGPLNNVPKGFVNMGTQMDIQPYIARADYLVQLSDSEAFSYSVLEALINHTPVIVTPFKSVPEYGIEDGKNGYIVPFDMDFDVKKLLNVPQFEYEYDNTEIVKKWKNIIGISKPLFHYEPKVHNIVRVKVPYFDIALQKTLQPAEKYTMTPERIEILLAKGLVELVED